ncbi:GNAT family N-acetyltransferase [Flavihumibacter sp. R14]|nr:GNAT family N-acetyltransferase [Flavihumibacter soli]
MNINDISIRSDIRPGDLGYVIYRHGRLYAEEYNYGVAFEMYVAASMAEFYRSYDPELDRVWICEHGDQMVGFILLMHRENKTAQVRYFYLEPAYRGIGLGKKLMGLLMDFLKDRDYTSAFLLTTDELHGAASIYRKFGFVLTEETESTTFGKQLKEQRYEYVPA